MLLLQDFSVKLFSSYKKTIGMTLQMNALSGATNTLRRPWYELSFSSNLPLFNCQTDAVLCKAGEFRYGVGNVLKNLYP